MNVPINKNSFTTLFNCIICKSNIQCGMLKLSDDDILCTECYTNSNEKPEFPIKKVAQFSFENKKSIFYNTGPSYFNVLYETEQKQNSECNRHRYFDRRIFNRDVSCNTNSKNVIDFSMAYPNDSNKKIFSDENIDNYINSKQYKMNRKNLLSCCICLNEFNKDEMLIKLRCKHVFHSTCMMSWLSLNSSCPMCRCDLEF